MKVMPRCIELLSHMLPTIAFATIIWPILHPSKNRDVVAQYMLVVKPKANAIKRFKTPVRIAVSLIPIIKINIKRCYDDAIFKELEVSINLRFLIKESVV